MDWAQEAAENARIHEAEGNRPEEAMQKPWDPVQINTTDSLTPFARRL